MDYEKRFKEWAIESYINVLALTPEEAEAKFNKMKEEDPVAYQKELDEYFDMVHPY